MIKLLIVEIKFGI